MIQLRMVHHLQNRIHRACFGVVSPINEPPKARLDHSPSAHRTRLNCNKQLTVSKPVVTNETTGLSQRNDFSMRGWIIVPNIAVPSARNHAAVTDHYCSHRHLTFFQGPLRRT